MPETDIPITVTIRRFCELSGIGRSKLYQMLDAGEIASIHVGGRRLIVVGSYLDLIERQRAAQRPVTAERP